MWQAGFQVQIVKGPICSRYGQPALGYTQMAIRMALCVVHDKLSQLQI